MDKTIVDHQSIENFLLDKCSDKTRFMAILEDLNNRKVAVLKPYLELLKYIIQENVQNNVEINRKTDIDKESATKGKTNNFFSWDFVGSANSETYFDGGLGVGLEEVLTNDILNLYLGIEGDVIKANELEGENEKRTFRTSGELPVHVIRRVVKLLPVASSYSFLSRFVERNSSLAAGRVNQSLAGVVSEELLAFMHRVVALEDVPSLDLSKVWSLLQEEFLKLHVVQQICEYVAREAARGGATLSVLHSCATSCFTDSAVQRFCIQCTKAASVPFFNSLNIWLFKGEVFDPFDEFMIAKRESRNLSYALDWEESFQIRKQNVPTFLEKVATTILETGKYMYCLKMSSFEIDKTDSLEKIQYDALDISFLTAIKKSNELANGLLTQLLNQEDMTVRKLEFAKSLFCIEYGDFFYCILETCAEELGKPISCDSYLTMSKLMQNCVENSSIGFHEFSKEIRVHLEKKSLFRQINDVLNVSSNKKILNNQSVMEALSLSIHVQWPLKIVLDTKTIKCYQMIFRHVFYTKYVFMALTKMKLHASKECHLLKYSMVIFTQTYISYMAVDTIETSWESFKKKYKNAASVNEIIKEHLSYIYSIVTGCMLSSLEMCQHLYKVFKICLKFVEHPGLHWKKAFESALDSLISASAIAGPWSSLSEILIPIFRKSDAENLSKSEYPSSSNTEDFEN